MTIGQAALAIKPELVKKRLLSTNVLRMMSLKELMAELILWNES
jgi:hypothetical protein